MPSSLTGLRLAGSAAGPAFPPTDVASVTGLQALALRQARGLWAQRRDLPAWDDLRREFARQPPQP